MLSALVALALATYQVGVPGVWAVAVHGDYVASAYDEKYVDLWLISTGKRVKRLKYAGFSPTDENSSAKIVSLDFSPDGSLLAGGSEEPDNGYAPMWEISSGREVAQLGLFSSKTKVQSPPEVFFSLDGQYVFGISNRLNASNFYAWDPRGNLRFVGGSGVTGHDLVSCRGPSLHSMVTLVANDSGGAGLRFWDIDDAPVVGEWENAHLEVPPFKDYAQMRMIGGGAKLIITGEPPSDNEESFVWVGTKKAQTSVTLPGIRVRCTAVSPDERTLYLGGLDGKIWAYSLETGKFLLGRTVPDEGNVRGLTVTADGQYLIAGTELYHSEKAVAGGSITIWSAKDLTLVKTIQPSP